MCQRTLKRAATWNENSYAEDTITTLIDFYNISRADSVSSMSYKTLINYIDEDNFEELRNFLNGRRVNVDDKDESGSTALHYAATQGKLAFVKELLEYGANANVEDSDNWTPLLCAAKEGYTEICIELLKHGADVDHRDMGKWNSLMWASYKNHPNTVMTLVENGADVNSYETYHISPLIWASGRGNGRIVEILVSKGAKVNTGDKYGTTPLVWASRKGDKESVRTLLKAGATVDLSGVYSWTALLVATMRNHIDIVNMLLEFKPNINITDAGGCSPLMISCKEGYYDIVVALLNAGAFINGQDRHGDTNVIHATRSGHYPIVEALLKKYANINVPGKDHKTATYIAVEKGYVSILKLLLNANPDLEIATKDGDTVLLRAVRSRHYEMVKLLLDRHARVYASDKKGDTALHIAMRSSSRNIVELLLRNPSHGQLLYRPNRDGETPYTIDLRHQKPLLSQVYGANRLNTNEDNEDILGYDLYSSTLADMLSAPSVSMPITVGLYARWGSGKNFLLKNLTEEMKIFAQQWIEPLFRFHYMLMIVALHVTLILGLSVIILTRSLYFGIIISTLILLFVYLALVFISYGSLKFDWLRKLNMSIMRKEDNLKVILKILFCNPQGIKWKSSLGSKPIRYYFTDHTRVSSTIGGENAVVQMIGSLFDAIEQDIGALPTRLYRAFTPKAASHYSSWHWRNICCIPSALLFELNFINILLMVTVFVLHYHPDYSQEIHLPDEILYYLRVFCVSFFALFIISNLRTWGILIVSLIISPRRRLQHAVSSLETVRSEGFLQTLRSEVATLINMVRCFDGFTNQQTRLVVIVDGLDSCEQDKVLLILDAVHVLFSDNHTPFIIILAIDPHVISMVVETNTRRLLTESNITGRDFLKNMVHVPFYLQNSGLRKVKVAQKCALQRKSLSNNQHYEEPVRRMSVESNVGSSEKLKVPAASNMAGGGSSTMRKTSRNNSRKLKISDSVNSSIASNINKLTGAQDLTRILVADDYFSDMNPRSMRRLLNIVYITGRLLKAFQIDFSWYQLAVWVNIVEQWPYRISCIILYHETNEETVDESMSLKAIYNKIRPYLKISKESEPLLEFDKDEKKFNVFLKYHRSTLLVNDLRIFLPFTINLDPYIKKVIKEEQQYLEDHGLLMNLGYPAFHGQHPMMAHNTSMYGVRKPAYRRPGTHAMRYTAPNVINTPLGPTLTQPHVAPIPAPHTAMPSVRWPSSHPSVVFPRGSWLQSDSSKQLEFDSSLLSIIPEEFHNRKLSTLTRDGVCDLLYGIKELQSSSCVSAYVNSILQNNISGRVLTYCNMDELKKTMNMKFGDWELFNSVVMALRELECTRNWQNNHCKEEQPKHTQASSSFGERTGSFSKVNPNVAVSPSQDQRDGNSRHPNKQTSMENQVSLEDQMLCGALQTLNEEACEDVMVEAASELKEIPHPSSTALVDIPVCEPGALSKSVCSSSNALSPATIDSNVYDNPGVIICTENSTNQQDNFTVFYDNRSDYDQLLDNTVISSWRPTFSSEQNISNTDNNASGSGNSVCSTPLQKRRKKSLYDRERKSSIRSRRPSSLLVPKLDNAEPILSTKETENQHTSVVRSFSVDGTNVTQNKSNNISAVTGNLVDCHFVVGVTSSCTNFGDIFYSNNIGEAGCDDDDDESTPLVSDISSPQSPIQNNNNNGNGNHANYKLEISKERDDSVHLISSLSDLLSPSSVKSNDTRDTSTGGSLNNLIVTYDDVDGLQKQQQQQSFCQISYVNETNYNSAMAGPNNCEELFNVEDSTTVEENVNRYSWSDTETTV